MKNFYIGLTIALFITVFTIAAVFHARVYTGAGFSSPHNVIDAQFETPSKPSEYTSSNNGGYRK